MAARFEKVSNSWKMLGLFLQEGRHSLVAACSGLDPALQSVPDLKKSLEDLDRDSLALLDSLRARFPRFYFAADRDVLHALANSSSPGEFSSSLLSAVFPGVKKLQVVRTNRTKQAEADKEVMAAPTARHSHLSDADTLPAIDTGGALLVCVPSQARRWRSCPSSARATRSLSSLCQCM